MPLKEKSTRPMLLFVWHIDDCKTYDFLKDDPQKLNRHGIIDDKRLIIYGSLKVGNTLYFNQVVCVQLKIIFPLLSLLLVRS